MSGGGPQQGRESPEAEPFRFLTDHNVPDSVGDTLIRLGNDVARLRHVMAMNATDPIVARAAIEGGRTLVSWDRDQQRFMAPRYAQLSRLSMSAPEMEGATRLAAVYDIVEFVLRRAAGAPTTLRVGTRKVQIDV